MTGASGNTGRQIARRLVDLGLRVRTATRSHEAPGAAPEHVRFEWTDPSSHDEALRGADRIYLVAPAYVDDPSTIMLPFLARALDLGVQRFVLLSASVIPEGAPGLGLVHRFMRERAPEWTVLQPSWFMQNFLTEKHHHGAGLLREGRIATATGDGRVGFVDTVDIAEVAVRALCDAQSHDTVHVITGPEALSYGEIASILSRVTGRPMRHEAIDIADSCRRMVASGMPERYAQFLAHLEDLIRQGAEDRVTSTVLNVTGRPPKTFEEVARTHLRAETANSTTPP
ncbi:NmrA family NAD(P)-binding protein [Chondromyces crocatus]|uniref:NmrA family NAD(P)-binding protein n=1 Tax=Chondromyces crocatus TaxID=52 RepID=UPI001FE1550E|nr:NmrA family NAD(P)-binding protein [Chondromyces crocatus]